MKSTRIIDGRPSLSLGPGGSIARSGLDHARHLMVAKVRGTFEDFDATIVVGENPLQSFVEFEAKTASVTTGTRDGTITCVPQTSSMPSSFRSSASNPPASGPMANTGS